MTGSVTSSRLINFNATGEGGTCSWDSGSPHFLGEVAVAVTSGTDGDCRARNFNWRLEAPAARKFLGQCVTLP